MAGKSDITLLVDGVDESDADAVELTRLAGVLAKRIPRLCELRTVYDGEDLVPGQHVPQNIRNNVKSRAAYKRNLRLASVNIARPMVDSVTIRQRPNGFRLLDDERERSVDAEREWRSCRMTLKARDLFAQRNLYGRSYAMVCRGGGKDYVQPLSPWQCVMEPDGSAAIVYGYDELSGVESLTIYRLDYADDGSVSGVHSRVAQLESGSRSIPAESDTETIYGVANGDRKGDFSFTPGYKWVSEVNRNWDYAAQCGTLPIVGLSTSDGLGLFEPYLSNIYRIAQLNFDRTCVMMTQAFRQRAFKNFPRATYEENDIDVQEGRKKVGDKIDFADLYVANPAGLWILPEGVDVWESQSTDVTPWTTALQNEMKQLADMSMTPFGINSNDTGGSASGADLKREGVLFKAQDLNERADDALVRIMRMALVLDGKTDAADEDFTTLWLPIMPIQYSDPASAASQLNGIVSGDMIKRKVLGWSEQDIEDDRRALDMQTLNGTAQAVAAGTNNGTQRNDVDDAFDALAGAPPSTTATVEPNDGIPVPQVASGGE